VGGKGLPTWVGVSLVALVGCGGSNPPIVEARTGLGAVVMDLFGHSDGFGWWDSDVEDAGDKIGTMKLADTTLTADGGGCGVYRWGICDATLNNGKILIHLPDEGGTHALQTFGLQRVGSAVQLDDGSGATLLSLQPSGDGNAMINGRTGDMIATTVRSAKGIQILNADDAYVGAVDGDVPAEIAALALGELIDTGGDPHIPQHALIVAAAMTWLR
jgi:hypothetical protein